MISGVILDASFIVIMFKKDKILFATKKVRFQSHTIFLMLSRQWTSFTRFTLLSNSTLRGYAWSGETLTKIQATRQAREDMARKLVRQVYEISAREKISIGHTKSQSSTMHERWKYFCRSWRHGSQWNLEHARKKLEVHSGLCNDVLIVKDLMEFIFEGAEGHTREKKHDESNHHKKDKNCWRMQMRDSRHAKKAYTKDSKQRSWGSHCQRVVQFFESFFNQVHKLIPVHQAMRIPDAKAEVDKSWE